jgi:hypothetical protein
MRSDINLEISVTRNRLLPVDKKPYKSDNALAARSLAHPTNDYINMLKFSFSRNRLLLVYDINPFRITPESSDIP